MGKKNQEKAIHLVEDFFIKVKKSLLSPEELPLPEREILEQRIHRANKMQINKEDIQPIIKRAMSELQIYFLPELLYQKQQIKAVFNEAREEEHKKIIENIESRKEKLLIEIRQLEESSLENDEDKEKLLETCDRLIKLGEKKQKLIMSYDDSFYLPSLDEIKQNERNDLSVETLKYLQKIVKNKYLLKKNQKYWEDLCKYLQYDYIEKDFCLQPHIVVSPFWTAYQSCILGKREFIREEEGESKTIEVVYYGKSKGRLAKLYNILVEKNFIEPEKEDAFIAVFSGFYLDYEDMLPIEWRCPIACMSDISNSNLTVLYYLITALRDWEHFCVWSKNPKHYLLQDILTAEDRKLIVRYFIHSSKEEINIKSLKVGSPINTTAIEEIEKLLFPFYFKSDK